MKVMKFGGSSVGSGERILHVAGIIAHEAKNDQVVIVVSAMYKVTDALISVFRNYKLFNFKEASKELQNLYVLHNQALRDLKLSKSAYLQINNSLTDLFRSIQIYLDSHLDLSIKEYDYIISFGERFSAILLSAALNKLGRAAEAVNANHVIVANDHFGNGRVLIDNTKKVAPKTLIPLLKKGIIPVVTGFFARTQQGDIITLGRGGSDYSATVIAHVMDADEVILWKEVDGVYSEDPKKVSQAKFYHNLSYQEALSLAEKGAKILHPEAMKPVASKGIVVRIKNTFRPEFRGTKIWNQSNDSNEYVKSILEVAL